MTDEATPRPWNVRKPKYPVDGAWDCAIIQGGGVIAECFGRIDETRTENAEANAARIVAAVNSYDPARDAKVKALVGAAERCRRTLDDLNYVLPEHKLERFEKYDVEFSGDAIAELQAMLSNLREALSALGETV